MWANLAYLFYTGADEEKLFGWIFILIVAAYISEQALSSS